MDISEVFEFSILALIPKSKTRKTRKYLQHLQIPRDVFFFGSWKFPRFPSFEIEIS